MAKNNNLTSKKDTSELKKWIRFLCILFIIYAVGFVIFNFVPFFNTKQHFIIVSNSMSPTISRGDIVIVDNNYNPEDLVVDTIISFYHDLNDNGKNEIVVHYIANVTTDEFGNKTFNTKRENVTSYVDWDDWEITQDDIIGIFAFKIPKLGSLLMFAESPFGKSVIIFDIVIIFLVADYLKIGKKKK